MTRRSAALLAVALLAASCSSGDSSQSSNTLLTSTSTTVAPPTTLAPATTTSTTLPATTTTSTTSTTVASTTTTTVPATDVAGSEDGSSLDSLEELPFTGAEPELTVVALLALLLGVWLLRWSGLWQTRLARLQLRVWRRPDAPSAEARPPWPPNAIEPRSDADRRFQAAARRLADRHGVSFLEGVDRYVTRLAASLDAVHPKPDDDPHARWRGEVAAEIRSIYGLD